MSSNRLSLVNQVLCDIRQNLPSGATDEQAVRLVVDALIRAGVDLVREPSLEETKTLLVEALRFARRSLEENRDQVEWESRSEAVLPTA